jgi:hypothetical protein
MRIYFNNLLDGCLLTGSGGRSGFPLANVQHPHLSKQWWSVDPGGQYVLVNAGAGVTITPTACGILGHNLTATATATLKGNSSDSWVTPPIDEALDPAHEVILQRFAGAAYQFFRFDIDDPANPEGFLKVGRLWLSGYVTIEPGPVTGWKPKIRRNDNVDHSVTRQRFADIGDRWREFALTFPPTEYSKIHEIEDMYDLVGNFQSVIMALVDVDTWDLIRPCYCGLVGDFEPQHHSNSKYTYSLTFEEDH